MALSLSLIGIEWRHGAYHVTGVVPSGWNGGDIMRNDTRFRTLALSPGYVDALAVLTLAEAAEIQDAQKPGTPVSDQSLAGAAFIIAHIQEWESGLD